MVIATCVVCQTKLEFPDGQAGSWQRCANCRAPVKVPSQGSGSRPAVTDSAGGSGTSVSHGPVRLKQMAGEMRRREEMQTGLRTARARQLHMLPAIPTVPGVEFHAVYSPATNLSGDFYDFITVGEGLIGISLGDVSGHGIEAGILMGMVKKAIQIHAKGRTSAAETLIVANKDLARDLGGETFFSASYGILDTRSRAFRFARAGHSPAILVNPDRDPPLLEVKPNGMVIGPDRTGKRFAAVLQEQEVLLQPGDLVFQYTDGVVEAPDRERIEFGEARVRDLLLKHARTDLRDAVGAVEDAVYAHIGSSDQEDDITMIAFRIV
jgi:sigma-B regulation protein RsbU (phosphoserine phosphatase)